MSSLSDVIKRIAVEANEAEKNDKTVVGTVVDCNRLNPNFNPMLPEDDKLNPMYLKVKFKIRVSDKITLTDGDPFLSMTKTMRDNVDIEDPRVEKPFFFHLNDEVLLMRTQKGSKYILMDKVV